MNFASLRFVADGPISAGARGAVRGDDSRAARRLPRLLLALLASASSPIQLPPQRPPGGAHLRRVGVRFTPRRGAAGRRSCGRGYETLDLSDNEMASCTSATMSAAPPRSAERTALPVRVPGAAVALTKSSTARGALEHQACSTIATTAPTSAASWWVRVPTMRGPVGASSRRLGYPYQREVTTRPTTRFLTPACRNSQSQTTPSKATPIPNTPTARLGVGCWKCFGSWKLRLGV